MPQQHCGQLYRLPLVCNLLISFPDACTYYAGTVGSWKDFFGECMQAANLFYKNFCLVILELSPTHFQLISKRCIIIAPFVIRNLNRQKMNGKLYIAGI